MREFCRLKRSSVSPALPDRLLLYGIPEKVVPMPLPVYFVRNTLVASRKPPGVKCALPMLKYSGDGFSSCGAGAGAGAAAAAAAGVGSAASDAAATVVDGSAEAVLVATGAIVAAAAVLSLFAAGSSPAAPPAFATAGDTTR